MMAILKDNDRKQLTKLLEQLINPVKLILFTQDFECEYCQVARELTDETSALSTKLTLEVHDFAREADLAEGMGIDKIPALAVVGDKDYGIRLYGIPSGYEFAALIETITDVSRRQHGLPANVVAELADVDRPVRMQVLITPT